VIALPEALDVAESWPQVVGSHCERDQDTPLLCGSFATEAVNVCVWPGWRVIEGGVMVTEVAA
jgi:hypothetical protein